MKYHINNLDCAHCANMIEDKLNKNNKIINAVVDFNNQILQIDGEISKDEIQNIIDSVEDGVVINEYNNSNKQLSTSVNYHILLSLFLGILVLLFSYIPLFSEYKLIFYLVSFLICGYDILIKVFKNLIKGQVFDENFLMGIASIAAFAIGQYQEAIAIMIFYKIGEFFQDIAVNKSRRNISELMDLKSDFANRIDNNIIIQVNPDDVKVNDIIIVKPGEKVPLDGIVIDGNSFIDNKSLTGESKLIKVSINDEILSGSINQRGTLKIKVTKRYQDSTVAKILNLLENSSMHKSKTENFITKFSRLYTPIIVLLALFIALIPPLILNNNFYPWIYKALVFLVLSCPCALVLSIPLSFFAGIGNASYHGILIKGANYLEALNNIDMVVFDKTGTITKGNFVVSDIKPINISKEDLIKYALIGEYYSNHPIANAIKDYQRNAIDQSKISNYQEISGLGISLNYNNKLLLVGNDKLMNQYNISFNKINNVNTMIYVAYDNLFMGYIEISDEIKASSIVGIKRLLKLGINKIVMLSGDNNDVVQDVAKKIGIKEYFSNLLPQDKVDKVLSFKKNYKIMFVGDGINDAPVLSMVDVGVAMGGIGSDAAIEAADVVIMNDNINKIAQSIDIAHKTRIIVIENIVLALSIKLLVLLLGILGVATIWEAVVADVGVALLAILNALRILKIKE
ncbi:MAG: cadmium-translocating P-type ATPase [Bacilli bacterium]|jgi:Cd2+/Zn2+-exporting ATPase|nr:cadmium-translocating P-type ATPase [Bacilli bacterium]